MKQNFTQMTARPILPVIQQAQLMHCVRCGQEYVGYNLVYGRREHEIQSYNYCRNEQCYGRFERDIHPVLVTE
jgi:hypothetical protein